MFELSSLLRNLSWRSFYNQISNFKRQMYSNFRFVFHNLSFSVDKDEIG